MRNNDSFMIKLSEEEIRAMPVDEKLNTLLKVTLPILATIYGNGEEGIKRKAERHETQLKFIWLLLIPILGALVMLAVK